MDTNKILRKVEISILLVVTALLPVTVLSIFANAFDTAKVSLLVISILLLLVLKSVRALLTNKIAVYTSVFDIPVLILAITYIASVFVSRTPARVNIMDAFFLPGSATIVISGVMFYYLANQLKAKEKSLLKNTLFFASAAYSLVVLLTVAGVFKAIPQLPEFVKAASFNAAGSHLAGTIFLLVTAPIGLYHVMKEKDMAQRALFGVSMGIVTFALLINLFNIFPGRPTAPRLPSYQTSWVVAIESIKNNPLLGVGPGGYLPAFSRYIPLEYNNTDIWSVRFTSGRSYALTLFTEVGIAGIAAFIILLLAVAKVVRSQKLENSAAISLGISATLLVLFPSSSLLLFIFFLLLAIANETNDEPLEVLSFDKKEQSSRLPIIVAVAPVFVAVLFIAYWAQVILVGDMYYKQALAQIGNNEARAYDTLQKAINKNLRVDRYRVSYAQLNLAIANSLASNEDITDQDRQTIGNLIQDAIQQGKVAVSLNPLKASNWEVLASIYRSVAPLAQGADAFAAQTYQQAIALDPTNPNYRITLGGIFYAAGQYNDAIDTFELAVRVKPDFANSYYNLAAAYREAGRIDEAINAMSRVLNLIDRNSNDFDVATKALEELQEKKANAQLPTTDTLTTPETTDENQEPVIELDENAAPPVVEENNDQAQAETEATETPAPTESPTPTETPLP